MEHKGLAAKFLRDDEVIITTGFGNPSTRFWGPEGWPLSPMLQLRQDGIRIVEANSGHVFISEKTTMNQTAPSRIHVFDLEEWLQPAKLDNDDLCLFGEVVSGRRVVNGGVERLNTEQWLQRWRSFNERHPDNEHFSWSP